MQDLSKGYVPIVMAVAMLGTAAGTGWWLKGTQFQVEAVVKKVTDLQLQVANLSSAVTSLNLTLAKGPQLPENIAFKADILRICIKNPNLVCPDF
jgi:hypothetical protein